MTEAGPNVRAAIPADAVALGVAHVRAWQATYRGMMPDSFLDALDPVERGDMWARALATPRPGRSTIVVCVGPDAPVGFAIVGAARDHDEHSEHSEHGSGLGELYAINLLPDAWGRGLGRRLLTAATEELGRLGFSEAVLWVASGNTRARRFYEAAGWYADGIERTDESLGPAIHEARYRRLVPVAAPA